MKRISVPLARILWFVSTSELNPRGIVSLPKLCAGITERFGFLKFPQKIEDYDEAKGIEFLEGAWDGIPVPKLVIYSNGILLDTRTSTDESERIVAEALAWAAKELGLQYPVTSPIRKRYLSQLLVASETPILAPSVAISNLAKRITKSVESVVGERFDYYPSRLDVDFDRSLKQVPVAFLTIQRAAGASLSEGKYFSEGPLSTNEHFAILEQFEADVKTAGF